MKLVALITGILVSTLAVGQDLKGAWQLQDDGGKTAVLIINENYLVASLFSKAAKEFDYTEGGKYTLNGENMTYLTEFNTRDPEKVGKESSWQVRVTNEALTLSGEAGTLVFSRVDKAGDHEMAGTWHITERAQEGKGALVKIHQTGTRKTLKILSATRFQWVAIDPGVKGFYGTGGGTYTAKDGKYTEHIEFFSRDNSRVGASLSFDWKLDNGRWDHSGASSKGDPIHEVWEKVK